MDNATEKQAPPPVAGSPSGPQANTKYAIYQSEISETISKCVNELNCQPILFIGSGLSRRYINGPSWDELLSHLADQCPHIDMPLVYFKQTLGSYQKIGQVFARAYREWAWKSGRPSFPDSLFVDGVPEDAYIKHTIAIFLKSLTPDCIEDFSNTQIQGEISALRKIRPHSIVTTNYDQLIELIFPEYQPIIGQEILRGQSLSIGEIFKIHGCVSRPNEMILTEDDYNHFLTKKKYLSAKLLTFFSEHPLIFIGYSATDLNIQSILSDIDEALPQIGGIIPNVFLVEWRPAIDPSITPPKEKLIEIGGAKGIRVNSIETSDLLWVFDALATKNFNPKVSAKLLRSLMSRSYELVRTNIPRETVEADFEMLERSITSSSDFAKLFGISTISDPSAISAKYPYNLTDVARLLGFPKGWHGAHKLLEKVKIEKGIDLKSNDNDFHVTVKYGATPFNKYSREMVDLLKAVRDGLDYDVT